MEMPFHFIYRTKQTVEQNFFQPPKNKVFWAVIFWLILILEVLYISIQYTMKTIITISLTLLFAGTSFSQDATTASKTSNAQPNIVQVSCDSVVLPKTNESLARLYRFRNTRVIKELTFHSAKTAAKLA